MEEKESTALTTPVEAVRDDDAIVREMSALAVNHPHLPALPKDHRFKMRDRKDVEIAFHAAFELMGGVPAMVAWGMKNPNNFYSNYGKMLPPVAPPAAPVSAQQVNIFTGLPPSKLDEQGLPTLDAHMYGSADIDAVVDDEEE